jgi:hypothetical protein
MYSRRMDVRDTQTAFAGKYWLLLGLMNKLKTGEAWQEKLGIPASIVICLCSKPFLLQSLCNQLGLQER